MAKYVSERRLQRALQGLVDLRQRVKSQGVQHILPLLALKEKGVGVGAEVQFEERDDFEFWDSYFLVDPGAERPYYDPFLGERRIEGHPHSNVATARKSTFERSWHAGSSRTEEGETFWRLEDGYLETVVDKCLTKSGARSHIPALDLVAWMRRPDEFPDETTTRDLVAQFRSDFNLNDREFDALFVDSLEPDAEFFAPAPLTPRDVLELIGEPATPVPTGPSSALPDFAVEPSSVGASMALPSGVVQQAATALAVGSHLILAGPPGTGKSTLAEDLCRTATRANYTSGYKTATATADWTTFDTIGGYMPTGVGNELIFQEGVVLCAISEDNWCVIDELNRSNIDRAIGVLITLLAGSQEAAVVELPYRHVVQQGEERHVEPVRVRRDTGQERSGYDPESGDYVIGRNWRLIATMNTFDRSNLFPLTAAFARRFATVFVGIPPAEALFGAGVLNVDVEIARRVFRVLMTEETSGWTNPRPLGPAIVKDAWRYVRRRLTDPPDEDLAALEREAVCEALTLYVLPQYCGLEPAGWAPIRDGLAEALLYGVQQADRERVRESVQRRLDAALRGLQGEQ